MQGNTGQSVTMQGNTGQSVTMQGNTGQSFTTAGASATQASVTTALARTLQLDRPEHYNFTGRSVTTLQDRVLPQPQRVMKYLSEVDARVPIRVVSCLLDELHVRLIEQGVRLHALLEQALHKPQLMLVCPAAPVSCVHTHTEHMH